MKHIYILLFAAGSQITYSTSRSPFTDGGRHTADVGEFTASLDLVLDSMFAIIFHTHFQKPNMSTSFI